jgi:hypothetical protein
MASRSRFVRPETKTIPISDGDTITVRRRLNMGQQRAAFDKMAYEREDGKPLRANPLKVGVAMVAAYLVDWSIVDFEGRHVAIVGKSEDELIEILNDMEPGDFEEIRGAIDTHVDAESAARAAEKNAQNGAVESSATSPSPADATGELNGLPS